MTFSHFKSQQLNLNLIRSYWQNADLDWAYPSYQRPYNWLIYTHSGEGIVTLPERSVRLLPNTLAVVPLNTQSHYRCLSPMRIAACAFTLNITHGPDVFALYHPPSEPLDCPDSALIEPLVPVPEALPETFLAMGSMYQLLAPILAASQPQGQIDVHEQRLMSLLGHIDKHLSEPLSVAELAQFHGSSEGHLSRWFSKTMGTPIKRYIQQQRIAKATNLLTFSQASIESIATRVGFEDPLYFSRVFKQHTGSTPSGYRKSRELE